MYGLFYLLGYLAALGFICLAFLKIRAYVKSSPLHIRWELYPVPHEGPVRGAYGGSYMEETDWWKKPRHVDHLCDIKAMLLEILFLDSTYHHNQPLWIRTYPFHLGLYALMGGIFIVIFAAILQLCGVSPDNGFMIFLGNIVNAISFLGSMGIAGGAIALILRRREDSGLKRYTTPEMYMNLGGFALFGILTFITWVFNPSYFELSKNLFVNLFTFSFKPLDSGWFVLNMLVGYVMLLWIPVTNMRHLLIKYFMYHDIRWGDAPTVFSPKNQRLIDENLQYNVDWDAKHVSEDGENKNWVDVATSNPAQPKEN